MQVILQAQYKRFIFVRRIIFLLVFCGVFSHLVRTDYDHEGPGYVA